MLFLLFFFVVLIYIYLIFVIVLSMFIKFIVRNCFYVGIDSFIVEKKMIIYKINIFYFFYEIKNFVCFM